MFPFPESSHGGVLEGHVEPVAVILCTDPAGGPEAEDEADLREDYRVCCWLGPVSCLRRGSVLTPYLLRKVRSLPSAARPVLPGLQVQTYKEYCKLVLR